MVNIIGDKELDAHLTSLSGGVDVTAALLLAAEATRTTYVEDVNSRSPGHLVMRYNPTREVLASNPGYSPNSDLGYLVNSTGTSVLMKNTVDTYATAEYALHLELGTHKMAPRPAMRPAFEENKHKAVEAAIKIMGDKLNG